MPSPPVDLDLVCENTLPGVPARVPGSVRRAADCCGAEVWLSPSSVELAGRARVRCVRCAWTRLHPSGSGGSCPCGVPAHRPGDGPLINDPAALARLQAQSVVAHADPALTATARLWQDDAAAAIGAAAAQVFADAMVRAGVHRLAGL